MERNEYFIVVTWREEELSPQLLDKSDFEIMRRNMIDEGFDNIHIEWYESGNLKLPDRVVIFVYWEAPDSAPSYEQVRDWGKKIVVSNS